MRKVGIEYPAARQVRFKDLGEPPALQPTQVLLVTRHSGITNGTERHALLGEHFWANAFPSVHGYQHVCTVEATGPEVRQFRTGDTVFYGQYVGHRGWHVVDVASAAASAYDTHLTIAIPDTVAPADCALLGVAGVAMRGARRARVAPGRRVWVAGLGLIGQFAAQSARALGAHVTVSDINPKRVELARQCGAHRAFDANAPGFWAALKEEGPYDCVIDCCGVQSLLMDVYEHQLLAYQGVVLLLAVRTETVFNWGMMHTKEASLEVSCHFSLDDLKVLLHFITHGIIRVTPLITHSVPIDDAIGIYEQLRDKPGDMLGVVFHW